MRLKDYLPKIGMTPAQLASHLGIAYSTVYPAIRKYWVIDQYIYKPAKVTIDTFYEGPLDQVLKEDPGLSPQGSQYLSRYKRKDAILYNSNVMIPCYRGMRPLPPLPEPPPREEDEDYDYDFE